jgi:hypothetical protein
VILSERQCRLIRHLCDGVDWNEACDREQVGSVDNRNKNKYRLFAALEVSNFTEVRLWASCVTDAEFNRLTGRTLKVSAAVA